MLNDDLPTCFLRKYLGQIIFQHHLCFSVIIFLSFLLFCVFSFVCLLFLSCVSPVSLFCLFFLLVSFNSLASLVSLLLFFLHNFLLFACSFLSYTPYPSLCMLLFVFLSFGVLLFSWLAKTQKKLVSCRKAVLCVGFSWHCSGIGKLKKRDS